MSEKEKEELLNFEMELMDLFLKIKKNNEKYVEFDDYKTIFNAIDNQDLN